MTEVLGAGADMKAKGRTRLKGVLDGLVQQSKDEKEVEFMLVDEDVEEGARDLLELNDEGNYSANRKRGRLPKSPLRRRGRKRMCKEVYSHSANDSESSEFEDSHIPHVMTLFDRRVDLARFTPDTPLYVMCREWMSNKPQKPPSTPSLHSSQTLTSAKPHPYILHPNTLPPPVPLSRGEDGTVVRLDIPKPHPPYTKGKDELDEVLKQSISGAPPDLSQLKESHVQRWKGIHGNWRRASSSNQTRYAQSFSRIKDMFRR